jgi:F-box protein 21
MLPFGDIPDEIIRQVLSYISPDDAVISVQFVSRRFRRLANEALLWRHHCQISFQVWDHHHQFRQKLTLPAADTDWKNLWITRTRRNSELARLMDGILATKTGRLKKFEQICRLGYDAKDFLLEQSRTDESAEDVLARR